METRRIGGAAGFDITVVGLGCNSFGRRIEEAPSKLVIHAALDAGINFFDTAEGYGDGLSEQFIGNALVGRRDEVILTTKFGYNLLHVEGKGAGSRENIMAAIDSSLKNLRTDYVDLYQIHKPDPSTPIAETLDAMNDLVKAGKTRLIGCSNFSGAQLEEAVAVAKQAGLNSFVTAQSEWSLLERKIEREIVPACAAHGIGVLPFYPIARGLLTGKYRRGAAAPEGSRLGGTDWRSAGILESADFDTLEALEAFAVERGYSLLTLAISWLASQPVTVSVISGATRPEQLAQNAASAAWKMSAEELAGIDKILK